MKNIEVVKAEYKSNYKIWIEFNDAKSSIVDLENDLWGKVFEPLKDKEYFKNFRISEITNTLEWSNGADFAPEYLYSKISE
jgi:hypothetical protein